MSNVLAIDRVEARAPSTAQIRLRRLSRVLALLFAFAQVFYIVRRYEVAPAA